jgi:hypothetical protein
VELITKKRKGRAVDWHKVFPDGTVSCNTERQDKLDILLPNVSKGGEPRDFHLGENNEVTVLPITEEMRKAEITWFESAFKEEISKAKKAYGMGLVTVEWGLVTYVM